MFDRVASAEEFVNRKVESIVVVGADVAERRVSVDINLPATPPPEWPDAGAATECVLLTLLAKKTLTSLSIRDEAGAALPSLTTAQNGWYAWSMMVFYAETLLQEPVLEDVVEDLRVITRRPTDEAQSALSGFGEGTTLASSQQRQMLLADPFWRALATDLAESFLLLAPIEWKPEARRIIKYSYVDKMGTLHRAGERSAPTPEGTSKTRRMTHWLGWRGGWSDGEFWWSSRFLDWLTWTEGEFTFLLPRIGDAGSYHFELRLPEGLTSSTATLSSTVDGEEKTRSHDGPGDLVHLNLSADAVTAEGKATLSFRPERRGFMRAAALTAVGTALLMGIAFVAHERISSSNIEALAALILAAPGLASTYLVRPGEHSFVSSVLIGPRTMLALSGGTSYLAALSIVFVHGWSLAVLLGIATVLTGLAAYCLWEAMARDSRANVTPT